VPGACAQNLNKPVDRYVERTVVLDRDIGLTRRQRARSPKPAVDFSTAFSSARFEPGGNRLCRS
jgi:hypothetical protein